MSAIIVLNDRDNGIQTQKRAHTHTHTSPPTTVINIIMTVIIHVESHWGLVKIIQSEDYNHQQT